MSGVSCTICLSSLNLKEDTVHSTSCGHMFHEQCLSQALIISQSCPQCRRPGIQHFQLFFAVDNDEEGDVAGGTSIDTNSLSRQIRQEIREVSKKLDNLTVNLTTSRRHTGSGASTSSDRGEVRMYRDLVDQLQRENEDLKEILEMEKILSSNTEREIEQLKLEVRERNDLINALQMQNDTLRDETELYVAGAKVPIANLLDL